MSHPNDERIRSTLWKTTAATIPISRHPVHWAAQHKRESLPEIGWLWLGLEHRTTVSLLFSHFLVVIHNLASNASGNEWLLEAIVQIVASDINQQRIDEMMDRKMVKEGIVGE